ncbi:hypothetical protein V1291_005163 [Nitrobacteraceae bacterium AZCC 1564]
MVQGLEADPKSGADFGAFIDRETDKWGGLIREAGWTREGAGRRARTLAMYFNDARRPRKTP